MTNTETTYPAPVNSWDKDRERLERALELLRRLEWAGWCEEHEAKMCLACASDNDEGHDADCELGTFLAEFGD